MLKCALTTERILLFPFKEMEAILSYKLGEMCLLITPKLNTLKSKWPGTTS